MNFSSSNSEECALAECHVLSKFICSGCTTVYYCCEDHQKADWRQHKKVCSPLMTLEISTALGRHFVASRDFKAGTLIVSELPLLVEPISTQKSGSSLDLVEETEAPVNNPSICLACCGPADGKKCPKCEWPICSIKCSRAKVHAENECQLFVKNALNMYQVDVEINYCDLVFLIRAVLFKNSQPELWTKILDMQSENSNKTPAPASQFKGKASGYCNEGFLSIILLKFQKLGKDFGEDYLETLNELVHLHGIQMMNAFPYFYSASEKIDEDKFHNIAAKNLYLKSSMFSHACFPNCFWRISSGPEFKMEIRTAVDIVKGQILSIDYNNNKEDMFGLGSMEHNLNEMMSGSFNCFCARCVDPTELNSMMSAVKCKAGDCTNGYLIPRDPKNFSPSSIWSCVMCGGQSTETWERIRQLTRVVENIAKKFQDFEPKKIDDLLNTLRKHLHPNHWVIQQFCQTALRELEDQLNAIVDEDTLDYYVKIIFYLLRVFHLTMPGLNFRKSDVQCKLFKALHIKLCIMKRTGKESQMLLMKNEMRKLFDEIVKIKKFDPRFRANDGQWKPNMMSLIAIKEKL